MSIFKKAAIFGLSPLPCVVKPMNTWALLRLLALLLMR